MKLSWVYGKLCSHIASDFYMHMTPMEVVQIDNQPQKLKKYQMYFKRRVIILTLGVYNLNIQKIFKCLQTF